MLPSIRHLLDSEMVGPTDGPIATETQAPHSHSHSHPHPPNPHPHHSHPCHSPSPPYARSSPPDIHVRHHPYPSSPSYPGSHPDESKPFPYPRPYSRSSASGPDDYHVRPHSPVHPRTKASPRTNMYYRDGHDQDSSWGPRSQAPAPIPSSYRMQHTPPFDASISSSSSTSPSPSMSTATAASTPLTTDAITAVTKSTAAASINDNRARLGHTPQTPHKPVFRDSNPDGMGRRYSDQLQSHGGLVHSSGRHSAQGWSRPSNGLAHPSSEDPRPFDSEYHRFEAPHRYHPDMHHSGHPQTKHQSLSPISSHPSHFNKSSSPPPPPHRPYQGHPDAHHLSHAHMLEQARLDALAHDAKHRGGPNPGSTSSPPSRAHPSPQPPHPTHPHYHPSLQQQRSPPLTDHVRESDLRPLNPSSNPKPSGSVQQTAPQAYLQHLTFQSYQPNRQRYATAHPTPSYGGSKSSSQGDLPRTRLSPGPSHPYHPRPSRSLLSGEVDARASRSLLPSSLEAKGPLSPPRSMAPGKPHDHDRRHVPERFEGYPEGSDYQDDGGGYVRLGDQDKAFHKMNVSHESFSDAHRNQGRCSIRMSMSESDLKAFEASERPHIKHEEVEVDELEEENVGEVGEEEYQEEYHRQRHPQYSQEHLHLRQQHQQQQQQQQEQEQQQEQQHQHQHQQQQQQRQLQQQLLRQAPQQQPHPHHHQAYDYDRSDSRDPYHPDPRMRDYPRAVANPSPSSFSQGYSYPPNQGGYIRHPNQYPHHQGFEQGPGMMHDELSRDPDRYPPHPPHPHPHPHPHAQHPPGGDPKMPNRRGPYLSRNRALLAGLAASSASGRYKCQYCSKRFSRPSSLRIHTYSHTGERPFKCSEEGCGRQFSVQSNMRRHLRVHRLSRLRSGLPDDDEEEM